ncbi:MAG: hypothetical protein JW900_10510 [Anaerolineae bacterium]|nr:hypothetical protein [Anaerolineae bacterium]
MNKLRRYINPWWLLLATLLPLLVLGSLVVGVKIQDLFRYDAAYFTAAYVERYDAPSDVALALEQALKNDDLALLAELQGLRQAVPFDTGPRTIFIMFWEDDGRYLSYLYLNMENYHRYIHYFELVRGRWVVAPPDVRYYLHSGRWVTVFLPLALVWWLVEMVVVLVIVVFRLSAQLRPD